MNRKSKLETLLFTFFLGNYGVHRFYTGYIGFGILWLLTGGLFGFGTLVDFIMICTNRYVDSNGNELDNDCPNWVVITLVVIWALAIFASIAAIVFGLLFTFSGLNFIGNGLYSVVTR